ncbi:hypothetical protein PMPD1_4242 [Paramixta manurensis]|uniref:Type III effector n=1 Tax=Paramixta manurensis TaxID=2740817 RepID=A0A6M8UVN9_9GAMM|nr:hypothetical protein PMPD1_4242 [Erwiniaceae bacterium PD-1]
MKLSRLIHPNTPPPNEAETDSTRSLGAQPPGAKRVGKEAAARVQAGQAKTTALAAKNSTSFKNKLTRRALDFSAVVPGSGRTINRPLRQSPPEIDLFEGETEDEISALQKSQRLIRHAQALVDSLEKEPVSLWQRPAESPHRRRLTKLIPWLKPDTLKNKASLYGSATPDKGNADERPDREAISQQSQALKQHIAEQQTQLEAAIEVLEKAYGSRATTTPSSSASETRIQLAEQQVAACSAALRQSIEHPAAIALFKLSDYADLLDKKLDFSLKHFAELKTEAENIQSGSETQRKTTELLLLLNSEKIRLLMDIGVSMDSANSGLQEATQMLDKLHLALNNLDNVPNSENQPLRREVILTDITRYQALREAAEQTLAANMRHLDSLDTNAAEVAYQVDKLLEKLNADNSILLQQHAESRQQWVNAAKSAALLNQATPPAPSPADAPRPDQAQLEQLKKDLHLRLTQVLGGNDAKTLLIPKLDALATRLIDNPALTKQPPWLVVDIVMSSLSTVTGLNASLASKVLDALADYPVTHWLTQRAEDDQAIALTALCRQLCTLPRGADLLQLLSNAGDTPPNADQSKALRTFWNADLAMQTEQDPAVVQWLGQARKVAQAKAQGRDENLDDVDLAAYNAVRNGYLSNAPGSLYARDNQRLLKTTNEWVLRALAQQPDDAGHSWREWVPLLNKTPFNAKTLERVFEISQSMGMDSLRSQVARLIDSQQQTLHQLIAHGSEQANSENGLAELTTAAQVVLNHLQKKDTPLAHTTLGRADLRAIERALKKLSPPSTHHHAGRDWFDKLTSSSAPPFIAELCRQKLTVHEALNRLDNELRQKLPEALSHAVPPPNIDEFGTAVRLLKERHFQDKQDILTFFKPLIEGSRLRDRVRLGGGGTLGIGLPSLPYNLASVVAPTFSMEVARSEEAFAQLFMPILGMEMSFGKARTLAAEVSLGVSAGVEILPGLSVQGGLTGRLRGQQAQTDATLMRFFRKRFQDDEMRSKMFNCLDSMVRWDTLEAEQGRAYSSPLEAVLARNPDVSISHVFAESDTLNLSARAAIRLPFASHSEHHDISQWANNELAIAAESERTHDRRAEQNGAVHVDKVRGDSAQQRVIVSAALNGSPLSNAPVSHGAGSSGRFSAPLQFAINRDIAWHVERHEISPFTIDDKQDADLDRHYSSATDMLAEISANREEWLMRCIETLEPDGDRRDTPELRQQAAVIMDEFEQTITQLAKQSKYCLYNVNYSLKGEAGAEIDSYRALIQLARNSGDEARVGELEKAVDEILQMRGSWRPLMLIIRERARDASTKGLRYAVRFQYNKSNEGQRTAAQFPPP